MTRALAAVVTLGLGLGVARAEPVTALTAAPAAEQEVGALVGLEAGGRTSPGGLVLGGTFLYQLSDRDWLDSEASFTFGGGGAECFRDRRNALVCDHGLLEGFGADAEVGLRRFFAGQGSFTPFARAGLGVRLVSYGADDLRGLSLPLFLGGGVRAHVADRIAVVGTAELRLGAAFFGRGLGGEPQASLAVAGGVEFALE